MLNQCTIIGRLGADPEVRSFQSGGRVANFRLAVTEKWRDKDGQQQERTEWVPVAIFIDGLVKVAEDYLRKGSMVLVQGAFKTRSYKDQSGNDRYSTEVVLQGYNGKLVLLGSGQGGGQTGAQQRDQQANTGAGWGSGGDGSSYEDLDDDLPF